jgi:para-nitrobenzyl esterase
MAAYWTNFAKRGDSNGAGVPAWPAFSDEKPVVIYFAESLRVLDGYFAWRRSSEGAAIKP